MFDISGTRPLELVHFHVFKTSLIDPDKGCCDLYAVGVITGDHWVQRFRAVDSLHHANLLLSLLVEYFPLTKLGIQHEPEQPLHGAPCCVASEDLVMQQMVVMGDVKTDCVTIHVMGANHGPRKFLSLNH